MKAIGIKSLLIFLLAFLTCRAESQLAVSFNAMVYGQTLEGLTFAQVSNSSGQSVAARLTIKVREVSRGNVVTITIPSLFIRPGVNSIDRVAFSNARFSFGAEQNSMALSQSGRFSEGEYEFCFEIEVDAKQNWPVSFFENCFLQQIQPMTPLLLIAPFDGDQDCNTRPDFTWQPPLPLPANARFRLVLVELAEKQDVAEAMAFNQPVINEGNIPFNQLRYPAIARALQEGKKYAWQVIVYTDKVILKRSEIWTYEVKCENEIKPVAGDGYREVKESDDGNFYVANRILRFSFNNPYGSGMLDYSISNIATPEVPVKGLPALHVGSGLNKYDLDLTELKAFKKGQEYLLRIRLLNGREYKLRFIYQNDSDGR